MSFSALAWDSSLIPPLSEKAYRIDGSGMSRVDQFAVAQIEWIKSISLGLNTRKLQILALAPHEI